MARLLSLNNYHYRRGGADSVFFAQDELFRGIGWETAVMAMHHPRNEPSPWTAYFVDELEFGHPYGLIDKAVMASKVVYSVEARRKLEQLLQVFQPDIAHAHCIYHHLSPSVLPLLKSRGIPVVMTAHDLKLACPNYKMVVGEHLCERCKGGKFWNAVRHRCVQDSVVVSGLVAFESAVHRLSGIYRKNLDRVIAPSQFMASKLIEWGWPASHIVHIPNFVDCTRFVPATAAGQGFVYFGRLIRDKGVHAVVKAALASGLPLAVVGTGPDEAELRALAAGHEQQIVFHGHLQGEALQAVVGGARAAVLASQIYENAPMSILEAYALGKPVIGARIGGIPELIRPQETGLVFESGSVEDLASCMQTMATLPDATVLEMGLAGRQWVEQAFSAERYVRNLTSLYQELGLTPTTDARATGQGAAARLRGLA